MGEAHVGYLDFDGKIARFQSAKCQFSSGRLDVEAISPKVKLHLYGLPFEGAHSIGELAGKTFGPTDEDIRGDPFAEGGVEIKGMWLSFTSMEAKCRSYDPETRLILLFPVA